MKQLVILLILTFNINYLHASSVKEHKQKGKWNWIASQDKDSKRIENSHAESGENIVNHLPLELPSSTESYTKQGMKNFKLGIKDFESGNYSRAILNFTKAIELDPKFAEAYYNRAIASIGEFVHTNFAPILKDLQKAIELNPNLGALENRGKFFNSIIFPQIYYAKRAQKMSEANQNEEKNQVSPVKGNRSCAPTF